MYILTIYCIDSDSDDIAIILQKASEDDSELKRAVLAYALPYGLVASHITERLDAYERSIYLEKLQPAEVDALYYTVSTYINDHVSTDSPRILLRRADDEA